MVLDFGDAFDGNARWLEIEVEVPDAAPSGSMRELLLRHAAEWKATHDAEGAQ